MHVAIFLLTVSFFFAQNSFSSAPLSGLDLLASVALDVDRENVLQVSDVDGLCSRFTDRGSLFKHIFALLQREDYINFQREVQASLVNLLVRTSKLQTELNSEVDFAVLPRTVITRIVGFSVQQGNLPLFKKLFELELVNLNSNFEFFGFKGNSIVFISKRPEFLDFALSAGLDLSRPVICPNGAEISAEKFLKNVKRVQVNGVKATEKRAVASTDSIDAADRQASKLQRTSASSSSSISANSDFHRQSDWKLLRNNRPDVIISNLEFYEAIRRRLIAEGPERIRALIELHPDYLDQSNFLFNLRVVLKNYLTSIAQIYSGNIEKTRKLLPYIRAQLQDPILYSIFVFELMRINPNHRFHLAYFDCLIGRSADDFNRMTALHDYSRLSLKNLIHISHFGANKNLVPLVQKIHQTCPEALSQLVYRDSKGIHIYEQVTTAVMLETLLKLGVCMGRDIDTDQGKIPTIFYFLSLRKADFTKVLMENPVEESLIRAALNYSKRVSDADDIRANLKEMLKRV